MSTLVKENLRGQACFGRIRTPADRPARTHRFYTKNAQTKPMPVHSRDAACPRPAYPRKMRKQNQCPSIVGTLLARVLRTHAPNVLTLARCAPELLAQNEDSYLANCIFRAHLSSSRR